MPKETEITLSFKNKNLDTLLSDKFNTDEQITDLKNKSKTLAEQIKEIVKKVSIKSFKVIKSGKYETEKFTFNLTIKYPDKDKPSLDKILELYPDIRADKRIYPTKKELQTPINLTLSHIKPKKV